MNNVADQCEQQLLTQEKTDSQTRHMIVFPCAEDATSSKAS